MCYKKHERIASNALLFTCGLVRLKLVEGQKMLKEKVLKKVAQRQRQRLDCVIILLND